MLSCLCNGLPPHYNRLAPEALFQRTRRRAEARAPARQNVPVQAPFPSLHGTNSLTYARRFVDATGRLPKQHDVIRGNNIGTWLVSRRAEAKRGVLSRERTQLMEDALGLDVLVPVVDFERQLADVAQYRRLYGRLPTDKGNAHQLGVWLGHRREDANTGFLTETHAQRLDDVLGAEWRPEFKNRVV